MQRWVADMANLLMYEGFKAPRAKLGPVDNGSSSSANDAFGPGYWRKSPDFLVSRGRPEQWVGPPVTVRSSPESEAWNFNSLPPRDGSKPSYFDRKTPPINRKNMHSRIIRLRPGGTMQRCLANTEIPFTFHAISSPETRLGPVSSAYSSPANNASRCRYARRPPDFPVISARSH
jgi:hypothetical protein